jgi:hypothetical protein
MRFEEVVQERFVVSRVARVDGHAVRAVSLGGRRFFGRVYRWRSCRGGEELGGFALGVGGRRRAGTDGVAVKAHEVRDGLGGVLVLGGDDAQVVLAVEVDAPAVAVGADRDDGPAIVGVEVDDEAAGSDAVMDPLRLVGDFSDLVPVQPVHRAVEPVPLGVYGLLESGVDVDGDIPCPQDASRIVGVVGLFVVDSHQHHRPHVGAPWHLGGLRVAGPHCPYEG